MLKLYTTAAILAVAGAGAAVLATYASGFYTFGGLAIGLAILGGINVICAAKALARETTDALHALYGAREAAMPMESVLPHYALPEDVRDALTAIVAEVNELRYRAERTATLTLAAIDRIDGLSDHLGAVTAERDQLRETAELFDRVRTLANGRNRRTFATPAEEPADIQPADIPATPYSATPQAEPPPAVVTAFAPRRVRQPRDDSELLRRVEAEISGRPLPIPQPG